jgi:ABC-2 type transport system ATP-binding protein
MIEARGLTRRFGTHTAVAGIDLDVARGDVVGFLGPNGAGKSTTLRMISGYLPPTAGKARVAGFDVRTQSRDVRRRIGYLPESTPLYPEMRVEEYMRFRARLYGLARRSRRAAIDGVLKRCWLADVRRQPIGQLSKGFRQRVGLAAAMLHRPPVLLLDEPTAGLDPAQIREVRALTRQLAGEHTVFLSTHILPEVEVTCDRVVIIARGRIRAHGRIDDLRHGVGAESIYVVECDGAIGAGWQPTIGPGVRVRAEPLEGAWRRLTITAPGGAGDLREAIALAVMKSGARVIRELRRETPSLEQLFIRLTSGDDDVRSAAESRSLPAENAA